MEVTAPPVPSLKNVRREIARGDQREKLWPADREEKMVGRQPREERQAATARIERAVAVEEPFFVDTADDRAEPEIFGLFDVGRRLLDDRHGTIDPDCCAFRDCQYSSILIRGMPLVIHSGAAAPLR